MRRFLVSSLLLHICALVDPSRKSTGWFVVCDRGHARRGVAQPSELRTGWERGVRAGTPRETASKKNG